MTDELKMKLDRWMRDITSLVGLPYIVLIILGLWSFDKIKVMWQFIFAIIISEVIIYVIRYFYFRPRPVGKTKNFTSFYEKLDESSFPSVHAARSFIFAVVLSQLVPMGAQILLWITAALISISRVYLKRHHWSDIIVGGILGLMVGYLAIIA